MSFKLRKNRYLLIFVIALSACLSQPPVNPLNARVTKMNLPIPMGWEVEKVKLNLNPGGCADITSFNSTSTIVGNTAYTYTTPTTSTTCLEPQTVTKEEEKDYQLLNAALYAENRNIKEVYFIHGLFLLPPPNQSDTTAKLRHYFSAHDLESQSSITRKTRDVEFYGFDYIQKTIKTETKYFRDIESGLKMSRGQLELSLICNV